MKALDGKKVGSLFIRGHSAGSCAGMIWETILAEFPDIEGKTVLAAIALPPSLLTTPRLSRNRQVHLIHHADDRLCVWNPSNKDMRMLQNRGLQSHISQGGKRTWVLPNTIARTGHESPFHRDDRTQPSWKVPQVLPFEVYPQAPLRLISWCGFELLARGEVPVLKH